MFPKLLLISVLLPTFIAVITCECIQSYMTICDTFQDFTNYTKVEKISELIIGSDHKNITPTSVNLMRTLNIPKYSKLTTLIMLGAINQLERTYGFQCTFHNSPLKYFSLYGNELKTIEPYQFPLVKLKKFSLVNNKIESIKPDSFTYYEIEEMDLSDNLLEDIERTALPSTNFTKIITIRNNKLTHIEPGSFPSSLTSLNLDENNLRHLQKELLEQLNLKELSLSHNKFSEVPSIDHMERLVIFDMSYNTIRTIREGVFKNMPNLGYLDLSNNRIASERVLGWLQTPGTQELTISLAYNGLNSLNFTDVSLEKKSLVLYGNPWDCKLSTELKKRLEGHESECDVEFSSTGRTPYCFDFVLGEYFLNNKWEKDLERFHNAVRGSSNSTKCDLVPERYRLLNPISFGCVA